MEEVCMADLLIENGVVITMDKQHRILKRGKIAIEDGRIKRGDLVMLTAFGSGYTWASAAIRW